MSLWTLMLGGGADELGRLAVRRRLADAESLWALADAGGLVRGWSAGAAAATGWDKEAAVGRPLRELLARAEDAEVLLSAAARAPVRGFSAAARAPDGSERRLVWDAEALAEEGRPPAGFELRAAAAAGAGEGPSGALERLASAGRMAGSLAHDLRTPLHVLASTAESLGEAAARPEDREALEMIARNAQAAAARCQALLDFLKTGTLALKPGCVDDAARAALALAEPQRKQLGARLSLKLRRPPDVPLDAVQLSAALYNLVKNGLEAAGKGGTLEVSSGTSGGRPWVRVKDDGPGLPAAARGRAGSAFFSTKPGGTGLGLYTSRWLLSQQDAVLELTSEPGRGTTALVSFSPRRAKTRRRQ